MSSKKISNTETYSEKFPAIKLSKKERLAYEARKKEMEEYNKLLSEVEEIQRELIRQNEDIIRARLLLSSGVPSDVIAERTNLLEEKVRELEMTQFRFYDD